MNETTIPASTPCPNCKGRGGWDEPEDCIVCEVCGGSGRVRNDTPTPPAPAAGSRRERPILFSAPMVRAILDGRKTQTRRVARPRFDDRKPCEHWKGENHDGDATMYRHCSHGSEGLGCPYGKPGDRLWVRETWCAWDTAQENVECDEVEGDAECLLKTGLTRGHITYRADPKRHASRWRSPIFMPRWASRITLEIVDVRVERLNAISEDAAKAEGAERGNLLDEERDPSYRQGFRHLWESINGRGSWISNPFVWVIEFTRVNTEQSGGT